MLVIKAEIWPHGEVGKRFEIAKVGLINCGGHGTPDIADYSVVSLLERDGAEYVAEGILLAHARNSGWQSLTVRALHEQEREPIFHPDYTRSVADLLRRG